MLTAVSDHLSGVGVWSAGLRYGEAAEAADATAELEALGYRAFWLPGRRWRRLRRRRQPPRRHRAVHRGHGHPEPLDAHAGGDGRALRRPERRARAALPARDRRQPRPVRRPVKSEGAYQRPVEQVAAFLDGLDAAPTRAGRRPGASPPSGRGCSTWPAPAPPAPTRTSSPRSTRRGARDAWAPGPRRRRAGRGARDRRRDGARRSRPPPLATTSGLPNYTNNWKRIGFTDDDLLDGGERPPRRRPRGVGRRAHDRRAASQEHRAAGADHVCIQALTGRSPPAAPRPVAGPRSPP